MIITKILFYHIIYVICTYNFYKISGHKYWQILIPVYNIYTIIGIIKKPKWWLFFTILPVSCVSMLILIWIHFIYHFDINKKDILLIILTLGLYTFFINYKKRIKFSKKYKKKNHIFKSNITDLLLSITLASTIHSYAFQSFTIPTESMEKTLLVGDFIFVNKFYYGLRLPMSPVSLPLIHNKIPILGIKSYLQDIEIPYFRFPDNLKKIKRNDIIVFNYPKDDQNIIIDKKENYIKRCVGLPGDYIEIIDSQVYVNNKKENFSNLSNNQYSFILCTFNKKFILNKILNNQKKIFLFSKKTSLFKNKIYIYEIFMTEKKFNTIKNNKNIIFIKKNSIPIIFSKEDKLFPINYKWTRDFYGPIKIPKKGDIVYINKENINIYYDIIHKHEKNNIKILKNKIFINNKFTNKYLIKKDYYFMLGDNRHNSIDSRYFGFVPNDHIIGKPIIIWLSVKWDQNNPLNIFKWRIRWSRLLKYIF